VAETCNVEPFRYQATPVPDAAGASANQINEQSLESYLARLLQALCSDLQSIEARLDDIEARLTALESP
jgi:hypothetical protein